MIIRQTISTRQGRTLRIVSVLLLIGGYTYLSYRQHLVNSSDTTIPSWLQLWDGLLQIVSVDARSQTRWLIEDVLASGERLFLGLGIGLAGAFVLGVSMGCFRSIGAFFELPLAIFASVPPTGMLAVFFVIVGINLKMYVAMIAFGILPTLAQAVYLGVQDVKDEEIWKAYTLGASHMEAVWHVIVRKLAPRIIDLVCLQIGPAVVFLIAAEMVCADVGFGYRIRLHAKLTHMNIAYPYLTIAAGSMYTLKLTLVKLRQWRYPWFENGGAR